ncbi:MAG: peptide chain release factor 3 [Chthoniobacterales bacterium]
MELLEKPAAGSTPAEREIARRRTFAIISHPDAGKTTLTEKFLLYGGALQLAGSVTARKNQRATTSDWMELERQRGISISSTVLQFEYGGCVVNLLDTPGHKDFSEDTYRVLSAVDAAVMVVDAAKGIEAQTRKLFEVCRQRGVPIFTFMNKLDRPAKPPLDLLDELENVLGIHALPVNWPLGNGREFRGVYDRQASEVHLFERTPMGAYRAPEQVGGVDDPVVKDAMAPDVYAQFRDEIDLLDGAGAPFDLEEIRAGRLTPVFFGSAMNNFGVQLLLDRFLTLAPPPTARITQAGTVHPHHTAFSGFVFKIQANMNPKHRDRVTFIRIVSGAFQRDMVVQNPRTGKPVKLSNSQRLFARDRETVDSAWAGDVIGIVGNQDFQIGDTLAEEEAIRFDEIPRFAPECFAHISSVSSATQKRFREGLDQLLREGVAQAYELKDAVIRIPLLGAVGPLQFEVLKYRLESEYGAECKIESAPWVVARWIRPLDGSEKIPALTLPSGARQVKDENGFTLALFTSTWSLKYFEDNNPALEISPLPFSLAPVSEKR